MSQWGTKHLREVAADLNRHADQLASQHYGTTLLVRDAIFKMHEAASMLQTMADEAEDGND